MAVVVAVSRDHGRGVIVGVTVGVAVRLRRVGPGLGLEGRLGFLHDQVHLAQQLGQHVVGLELQAVGLQFHCTWRLPR